MFVHVASTHETIGRIAGLAAVNLPAAGRGRLQTSFGRPHRMQFLASQIHVGCIALSG